MDLRQLGYFVAVAEELHFGRAADRLFIASPSLSQQIAALERSLGVRLFDRDSRRVVLTSAGRALLPQARRLLAGAEQLRLDAAAHRVGYARHRLLVGLRPGGFGPLTGPLLDAVSTALPDLSLAVRLLSFGELATAVTRGRVDVLLTTRGPVDPDTTTFDALFADQVVAAVPARSDLATAEILTAGDIVLEPLLDDVVPARLMRGTEPAHGVGEVPSTTEELLLRVVYGGEAFAVEGSAASRAPGGIAFLPIEGVEPVIAGVATRCDDDRQLVTAFREAALAAVPSLLHLLPTARTLVPEPVG